MSRLAQHLDRLAHLEQGLGSPSDPRMPLSFASSLHADETETAPEQAYRALRALGLQALFVPAELGGQLHDLDQMVLALRSIFRRDPAIGLGFGVTTFMAALPVWHSGTPAQKQWLADTILTGKPVSVAFHEPAHGNDLAACEFAAVPGEAGFTLTGSKNVINNVARAAAATVFARTGAHPHRHGMREHSLLLLDRGELAQGQLLARTPTLGARACELRGWRARDLAVSRKALIGTQGHGFEIAAQAFQVTRAVLPGMAVGIVDTAWRLCHRFLSGRMLFGGRALDLPLVQRDLSGVFTDLLAADAVSLASARMAQAMPGQLSLASCIAKSWVPQVLAGAMKQMSVMLGARHYVREGDYGYFQKLLRDLPVVMIGHASSDLCLALLIPQLQALARFARMQAGGGQPRPFDAQGLETVFRLGSALPALRMDQLVLVTRGRDAVLQALPAYVVQAAALAGQDPVQARACLLAREICERHEGLVNDILQRAGAEPMDGPGWIGLARRYAQIYAATCILYVWHFNRDDALSGAGLPFDAAGFDVQMLHAVERQLRLQASAPAWIASALDSMERCAAGELSAGLLRIAYAPGAPR